MKEKKIIVRNILNESSYLLFFSYILSTVILTYCTLARVGFIMPFKALVLSHGLFLLFVNLCVLLPSIYHKSLFLNEIYKVVTLYILSLLIISYIPYVKYIIYFFSVIGIILSLCAMLLIVPKVFNKKGMFFLVCTLCICAYIVGFISQSYSGISPLLLEKLSYQNVHQDILYHMSIAQMIKTYGLPSIGIDGLMYTKYHIGSHYLFARYSILLDITVNNAYNLLYPIFFIPLFFFTLISSAFYISKKLYKKALIEKQWVFWGILCLMIIRVIPGTIKSSFFIGDSYLGSNSHLIGLTIFFCVICFCIEFFAERKNYFLVIIICVLSILLFFLKVSIGVLTVLMILWLTIRNYQNLNRFYFTVILLYLLTAYFAFNLSSSSNAFRFSLLNFPITWGSDGLYHYFYYVYFINVIIYLTFRLYPLAFGIKFEKIVNYFKHKKGLDVEVIILITLFSALPGLFLDIPGGSAYYFSDVASKLGLLLILSISFKVLGKIENKFKKLSILGRFYTTLLVIPFIITFSLNIFQLLYTGFLDTTKIRYAVSGNDIRIRDSVYKLQEIIERNPNYQWLKKLEKLDKQLLSKKEKQVLYIPKNDSLYYQYLTPHWHTAFIGTALSGLVMLDGLPYEEDLEQHFKYFGNRWYYGLKSYMSRDTIQINTLGKRMNALGLENKEVIEFSTKASTN